MRPILLLVFCAAHAANAATLYYANPLVQNQDLPDPGMLCGIFQLTQACYSGMGCIT